MGEQYNRQDMTGAMSLGVSTNAVLKNTYRLLAMTLLFSAVCAYAAVLLKVGIVSPWLFLIGAVGLQFLISFTADTAMGIWCAFLFTGFIGFTTGPMLNLLTKSFSNGSELIMIAAGGTAMVFFALSGYVLTTKKDMSFLSGAIVAGSVIALVAMIASLIFNIPSLHLSVCVLFMILSSALIMYQTSAIINGGETNYVIATVGLYLSIYNIFISLVQLLISFAGNER